MLIILVSIAELEITLNHQPFSDHFMNLPSKRASTIYYISIMYVVYLVVLWIWQFGKSFKDRQINCMPLSSIYTASMDVHVFTHSTEICQLKISPIALFEQIAKYSTHQ